MAVSDQTALIILAYLLVYVLLYRKNSLIGNIVFMGLGLAIFTLTNVDTVFSFVLFFGSVLSFVYDLLGKFTGSKR